MTETTRKDLGQYFTPTWAVEEIVRVLAPHMAHGRMVEPTCGDGGFLNAMPRRVDAIGVEIDPVHAAAARARTGRQIILGDFSKVPLPFENGTVDFILGNPPYKAAIFDKILDRAHDLLCKDGEMGFILPAYMLQTPSRVLRYAEDWRLETHMLPRTLFPGLKLPISFVFFRKGGPQWVGMALYEQAAEVEMLSETAQETLKHGAGSVWRSVVLDAIASLGGTASVADLYAAIEGKRPTKTQWWKEKVRQVANDNLVRIERGVYALPERVAA